MIYLVQLMYNILERKLAFLYKDIEQSGIMLIGVCRR